jgi:hypothetical protein
MTTEPIKTPQKDKLLAILSSDSASQSDKEDAAAKLEWYGKYVSKGNSVAVAEMWIEYVSLDPNAELIEVK